MKLVKKFTRQVTEAHHREARVYLHADWNEYVVRFYINGTLQHKADYHADDVEDATDTADYWTNKELPT